MSIKKWTVIGVQAVAVVVAAGALAIQAAASKGTGDLAVPTDVFVSQQRAATPAPAVRPAAQQLDIQMNNWQETNRQGSRFRV
jgi:hypothetical protein